MSTPEEQKRIKQNVQRAAGRHALKEIRDIVDEDLREEAEREKLLRILLRYGGIVLLLAGWLLLRYFGVI